jgi:hypothetical protein
LMVASDRSHTTESYYLWKKLQREPDIKMKMYNYITKQLLEIDESQLYGNDYNHLVIYK